MLKKILKNVLSQNSEIRSRLIIISGEMIKSYIGTVVVIDDSLETNRGDHIIYDGKEYYIVSKAPAKNSNGKTIVLLKESIDGDTDPIINSTYIPSSIYELLPKHFRLLSILRNHNIKEPIRIVGADWEKNIPQLVNRFMEFGLVKIASYKEQLSLFNNDSLKTILRNNNCQTSGKKEVLVNRIIEELDEFTVKNDETYYSSYCLTEFGMKFWKDSYSIMNQIKANDFRLIIDLILNGKYKLAHRCIILINASCGMRGYERPELYNTLYHGDFPLSLQKTYNKFLESADSTIYLSERQIKAARREFSRNNLDSALDDRQLATLENNLDIRKLFKLFNAATIYHNLGGFNASGLLNSAMDAEGIFIPFKGYLPDSKPLVLIGETYRKYFDSCSKKFRFSKYNIVEIGAYTIFK